MDKLILNLKEASQYLNISQSKLSGLALKKEIRSYKIGKCRRFNVKDLNEFLESHAEGGDNGGRKSGGSSRKEACNE
jgi:excisionase family DNA binding protein